MDANDRRFIGWSGGSIRHEERAGGVTFVYILIGAAVFFIWFYWWSIRKARKDGATGQIVKSAANVTKKDKALNEAEIEIDKEFDKKEPSSRSDIDDFFQRGG